MVGGAGLPERARSTWPPTATASRAPRSSRSRSSPRSRRGTRPTRSSRPRPSSSRSRPRCEKNGKEKIVTDTFEVNNYDDKYLGSRLDRDRDHLLRQLRLLAARDPGRARRTSPRRRRRWGSTPTSSTPAPSTRSTAARSSPYNPALILGGLKTGVTPLEMAHAYNTLAENGQLDSAARWPPPPAARSGSTRSPTPTGRPASSPNDGGSGQQRDRDQAGDRPRASPRRRGPSSQTVVTSGTGVNAHTGDPGEFGKTGTTDNNGDAWFVGANQDITVAVWVGYADSVTPMVTEYGGAPVDGGTIPARDLHPDRHAPTTQLQAYLPPRQGRRRRPTTTPTPYSPRPLRPRARAPAPTTATPAPSRARPPQPSQAPALPATTAREPTSSSSGGAPSGGAPSTGGVSG